MKNGMRDKRSFLYKKKVTERDKRKESYRDIQSKKQRFHGNKTTYKVLLRSLYSFLKRQKGAKLLSGDRTVGWKGTLISRVMYITRMTGNDSVMESSRNAEDTTRGANYSINHQSIAGRS